jgi:biotin carboxylase
MGSISNPAAMQPEALLVDTNRGSYPLWRCLRDHGWRVGVVGADPQAPLARFSDHLIQANYADGQALAAIVPKRPWQAIIPGCTDASYRACAALPGAPLRGFDSPQVVQQLFDKQALRQLATELGICQPALLSVQEALKTEAVLVKPVDGFSGGGISQITRPSSEELEQCLAAARLRSPSGQALIEEFVDGQLYSHSAFLCSQQIAHDFFVQEDCIDYPYAVDTSCIALDLADPVMAQVRADMQRLAQHLQLVDGLLHSQFLVRDGQAYLLEITRRHPGDLYGLLIQHATGFDYSARYLNGFLPEPIEPRDVEQEISPIIRHTITAGPGCDLWSLRFHQPVKIRQWVPLGVAGDHLAPAPQGRAAIIFVEAETAKGHLSIYSRLVNREFYSFVN